MVKKKKKKKKKIKHKKKKKKKKKDFPPRKNDWKKSEINKKLVALNILHVP